MHTTAGQVAGSRLDFTAPDNPGRGAGAGQRRRTRWRAPAPRRWQGTRGHDHVADLRPEHGRGAGRQVRAVPFRATTDEKGRLSTFTVDLTGFAPNMVMTCFVHLWRAGRGEGTAGRARDRDAGRDAGGHPVVTRRAAHRVGGGPPARHPSNAAAMFGGGGGFGSRQDCWVAGFPGSAGGAGRGARLGLAAVADLDDHDAVLDGPARGLVPAAVPFGQSESTCFGADLDLEALPLRTSVASAIVLHFTSGWTCAPVISLVLLGLVNWIACLPFIASRIAYCTAGLTTRCDIWWLPAPSRGRSRKPEMASCLVVMVSVADSRVVGGAGLAGDRLADDLADVAGGARRRTCR